MESRILYSYKCTGCGKVRHTLVKAKAIKEICNACIKKNKSVHPGQESLFKDV